MASVLALTLIGCAPSTARPSADEIKAGLTAIASKSGSGVELPEKYATCVSDALLKSDISDSNLAKIASAKDLTADDVKELNGDPSTATALTEAATSCASTLE